MALQKDYNFTVEFRPNVADEFFLEKLKEQLKTETITFENAYHKIIDIKGNKNLIEFTVGVFTNQNQEKLVGYKFYKFTPDVEENSANFLQQGYEFIKTLEEYETAEDC